MTYAETIRKILIKNHYKLNQLAIMCGINPKRFEEIANFCEPSEKEKHCIDILEKFVIMSSKSLNYEDEIIYQKDQVEQLKGKLCDEKCEDLINSLIAESMYLGLFYANNLQDSIVEKEIRKVRCVK